MASGLLLKRIERVEAALRAKAAPSSADYRAARRRLQVAADASVEALIVAAEAGKPMPAIAAAAHLKQDEETVAAWEKAQPPGPELLRRKVDVRERWARAVAEVYAGLERGEARWPGELRLALPNGRPWLRAWLQGLERLAFARWVLHLTGKPVLELEPEPVDPDHVAQTPAEPLPTRPGQRPPPVWRPPIEMTPPGALAPLVDEPPRRAALPPPTREHPEDNVTKYGGNRWPT